MNNEVDKMHAPEYLNIPGKKYKIKSPSGKVRIVKCTSQRL